MRQPCSERCESKCNRIAAVGILVLVHDVTRSGMDTTTVPVAGSGYTLVSGEERSVETTRSSARVPTTQNKWRIMVFTRVQSY